MRKLLLRLSLVIFGITSVVMLAVYIGMVILDTTVVLNEENFYNYLFCILGIGVAVLVTSLFLSIRYMLRQFMKPIEEATETANHLLKRISHSKIDTLYEDDEVHLTNSISELAETLRILKHRNETETVRLATLIENIGAGLVFIDSQGYISLLNRTFRNHFQIQEQSLLNKPYYQGFDQKEIVDLIDNVFMTEKSEKIQVEIPTELEMKTFYVAGEPIFSNENVWKGVLVVYHDITELKRLENIRKDFVANVSHELNTPITSLKGFAETLLDGAKDDPVLLEQFLKIIDSESGRLQLILRDLLELSIVEKDEYQLDVLRINVISVIKETFAILQKKAEQRNISLSIHSPSEEVYCEADPFRMKQVLINLITNAISYSSEEAEVEVGVEESENIVTICVKDSGIGIEESHFPRIFERFYRVDKARSRAHGGTGLGLAIVKHIMEVHGGHIAVESELGKGSIFKVSFLKNSHNKE